MSSKCETWLQARLHQQWFESLSCHSKDGFPEESAFLAFALTCTAQNAFIKCVLTSPCCHSNSSTTRATISISVRTFFHRKNFACSMNFSCAKESPRSEEHTSELQSRLHLVCR